MIIDERLLQNLKYQLLTRAAIVGFILLIGFVAATTLEQTATPLAVMLVLLSIFISIFGSLSFYMRVISKGPISWSFELRERMMRPNAVFPVFAIIWDLCNLTFLVIVTGGLTSPFMPLFVIAVLVSDLCVDDERDRSKVTLTFVIAIALAIGFNEYTPIRCPLITGHMDLLDCPKSIWALNPFVELFFNGAGFVLSTIYGSSVLRAFIKRATANQNQRQP